MGFAKAAAALQQGIAPAVQAGYSNAANADAGYAKGLSAPVQQGIDQSVAANNQFLTQTGAPASALATPADVGGTAYGLEGYIPATTLQREGAAFGAAANMLPGDVLAQGQRSAVSALGDMTNISKLQTALADLASKQPALYQSLLSEYENQAYKNAELRQGQMRLGIEQQNADTSAYNAQTRAAYEQASLGFRRANLKLANQRLGFSVQQAIAKGQMPDSALSHVYGYVVDANGDPILGPKGQKIKVASAGKGKGGLPSSTTGPGSYGQRAAAQLGISVNEYHTWMGKAGNDALIAWQGFYTDKQGNKVVIGKQKWKQALTHMIQAGIPAPIAMKALRQQGYMPGVLGAPPISKQEREFGAAPKGGMGGGNAGGFLPQGVGFSYDRQDQGRDIQTRPGQAIIAPGDGYVVRIGSDPGGGGAHFGPSYPIVHFVTGPYAGQTLYVGHTVAALRPGQHFRAGAVLSHTQHSGPLNGGAPDGWAEIGFAPGGSPGAFGQKAPF